MRAEKSQDLPAAGWRPRGANERAQAEGQPCQGGANVPVLGETRRDLALTARPQAFALFRPPGDWMRPTRLGDTICFAQSLVQMLALYRLPLTLTAGVLFKQMSGCFVSSPSWHIELAITPLVHRATHGETPLDWNFYPNITQNHCLIIKAIKVAGGADYKDTGSMALLYVAHRKDTAQCFCRIRGMILNKLLTHTLPQSTGVPEMPWLELVSLITSHL